MDICSHEPTLIAFGKFFGASASIVFAAIAWLTNKFLGWCVWETSRLLDRYELMKALRAEIRDNMRGERYYTSQQDAAALIERMERALPAEAPLMPYIAVDDRNLILDGEGRSLRKLPLATIETVVAYYTASVGLTRQLIDFREPAFAAIGRERQREVIFDTYREGAEVIRLGEAAIANLTSNVRKYWSAALAACVLVAIALIAGVWAAAHPTQTFVASVNAAVEWASTCDKTPQSQSN